MKSRKIISLTEGNGYSEPIYGEKGFDDEYPLSYYKQPTYEVPKSCYCPICDKVYTNEKGLNCFVQRCPKCGSYLTCEWNKSSGGEI